MKICIINSLGKAMVNKCLNSLLLTTNKKYFDYCIVKERETRGKTLNYAVNLLGTHDDLLLVADDIIFTKGWFESLKLYEAKADIWGMSMLYPKTTIIQDRGYNLVSYDGKVILDAKDRGKKLLKHCKKGWNYTDCVCGCFLYIRSHVFKVQKKFYPKEGANRWDEFTFISYARSKGMKTAVNNHFLYHSGTSTKNNKNLLYRSISYQVEKKLWHKVINHFIKKSWVRKFVTTKFSNNLINVIKNRKNKILIYGAGTVSEQLIARFDTFLSNATFVSGLPEEFGKKIAKKYTIKSVHNIKPSSFDWILITPTNIGKKIYNNYFLKWVKNNWSGKIICIEINKLKNFVLYKSKPIKLK